MSHSLQQVLQLVSPRYAAPRRRIAGPAIWACAVLLFAALLAQAFVRQGIGAWSVGLVYIVYDTALLAFVVRRTLDLTTGPATAVEGERRTLGVVIAAYNEAPVLAATIDALLAQDDRPDIIIIADDGSGDGSEEMLQARYGLRIGDVGKLGPPAAKEPRLRHLRLHRGGKARALNAAIELLDTDLIVTVDADTLVVTGAIAAMRDAFTVEPALAAVTGVLRPVCAKRFGAQIFEWFQTYEYVRNFLSRYAWMKSNSLLLVSGAFAGFRREVLRDVGGFDPDCLVEDYEILHRIHRLSIDRGFGWTVRVLGSARATTDAPAGILPFLRQRRRWFAGFLQTQYWNRDMIGNARYGTLGTAMLPVKALDTVQPLYGLAAAAVLVVFIASGNWRIAGGVIVAMAIKIVIDLAYLVWSLERYRRWTGDRAALSTRGAILAAVVEPFTFQLLRHAGAAWGWWVFLTGRQIWSVSERRLRVQTQSGRGS